MGQRLFTTPFRTSWNDISGRFCEPRECVAAYLALEAAEVIAGVKPANLIAIPNRTRSCGSNMYRYWKRWGAEVAGLARLEAHSLVDRENSLLVLMYRPDAMDELLAMPAVRAMLRRAGYQDHLDVSSLLETLAERMKDGVFPHEIGIFLGYPLKDVAGFMGLANIPYACQGPWKIYGNPLASLQLAETYRSCRKRMAEELNICSSPFDCLPAPAGLFSHHTNDINSHLHKRNARVSASDQPRGRELWAA